MTVLKLFHLIFIYTSSLIIKKKKKRKSQSFKTALNYFRIKINKIIKKEIHLSGNCSYIKKELLITLRDTRKKRKKEREIREEEKIDSPVLLSTLSLKLRSEKLLERRLSFLKNTYKYDL